MRALAQSGGSLRVLGTARYKFHVDKPEKGRAKFGSRVHPRIVDFLSHCQRVDDEFDQGTHDRLSGVADITWRQRLCPQVSILVSEIRHRPHPFPRANSTRFPRHFFFCLELLAIGRQRELVLDTESPVRSIMRPCFCVSANLDAALAEGISEGRSPSTLVVLLRERSVRRPRSPSFHRPRSRRVRRAMPAFGERP